eukprot:gb/GECH01008516.1/.p1 GENE.gb/GECH01008516.1/~~gb/GECH01008516.1/.p1  ORF type:complete len:504 (+),score=188.59 gb/GECH01008516.1/:1-1512(+)
MPLKEPTQAYLNQLLEEKEKLAPFEKVLGVCCRLLNDEITSVKKHLQELSSVNDDISNSSTKSLNENEEGEYQESKEREEVEDEGEEVMYDDVEDENDRFSDENNHRFHKETNDRNGDNDDEDYDHHHNDKEEDETMNESTKESTSKHDKHSFREENEDVNRRTNRISATEILLNPELPYRDDDRYVKTTTLNIPVDKYPRYNFIGKILGPRGKYLKRIETQTDCRILIRGRGSMRNEKKERALMQKKNYEHLAKPLHLLIEARGDTEDEANAKIDKCIPILKELLVPVSDEEDIIKQQQLKELRKYYADKGQPFPPRPPSYSSHHHRHQRYPYPHHHPPPPPASAAPPHAMYYSYPNPPPPSMHPADDAELDPDVGVDAEEEEEENMRRGHRRHRHRSSSGALSPRSSPSPSSSPPPPSHRHHHHHHHPSSTSKGPPRHEERRHRRSHHHHSRYPSSSSDYRRYYNDKDDRRSRSSERHSLKGFIFLSILFHFIYFTLTNCN